MAVVRYYAGARVAAGVSEEQVYADDLAVLLARLRDRHGEPLTRVLTACSFLVDGEPAHPDRPTELTERATVDVLPPFAGG